jgi:hypothetical protein
VTAAQRGSVVWLLNQDAESSLLRGWNASGQFSNTSIIAYDADGNLRLCGRPAITLEQCSTVGTEGDIIAFATSGYTCGFKRSTPDAFVSMHVN